MIKKYILIFIIFNITIFADSIYFMPKQANKAMKNLIDEIKKAKKEVKIAIYSFTNREISKAIRDSAKNGVKYKIIFDYEGNINDNYSQIGYLAKLKNIEVCLLKGEENKNKKYYGKMHNKLAVIDNKTIIFGSANWSKSAFESNYETLVISNNKDYIKPANLYFNEMLNKCEGY